jgi:hypothetical protein
VKALARAVKVRLVNPDGNGEIEIQSYNTSFKVSVKDIEEEVRKHQPRCGRNCAHLFFNSAGVNL